MARFLLFFFLAIVNFYPRSNIRGEIEQRIQSTATSRSSRQPRTETITKIDLYNDEVDQIWYQRR
jgi:hypothetical protein